MKTILLIGCLVFLSIPSFTQQQLISFRTEQNADRTSSIYAESKSDASYTVKLYLTLAGYTSTLSPNPGLVRVTRGTQQIAKVTPDNTSSMHNWNYRYQYFAGVAFSKMPDTSIVYLLPGTAGNMLVASAVTNSLPATLGVKVREDYVGIGFMYQFGDTICAARAGTVYESYAGAAEGEKYDQIFSSKGRNLIYVQHKDGSISNYSVLAPIKMLVTDGENVVPGQPLAVFNKEADKYKMIYSVTYLDEKKIREEIADPTRPTMYGYLRPGFFTGGAANTHLEAGKTYTVEFSKEVIARELSRKEKKNLGLQ